MSLGLPRGVVLGFCFTFIATVSLSYDKNGESTYITSSSCQLFWVDNNCVLSLNS